MLCPVFFFMRYGYCSYAFKKICGQQLHFLIFSKMNRLKNGGILDLRGEYVTSYLFHEILRLLKDNSPLLNKLYMSDAMLCMTTFDFINRLVAALKNNTFLQVLKLDCLGIQNLSAEKLATLLVSNTGLIHINLFGNPFDVAEGDVFESALEKNTTIQVLNIAGSYRFKNRLYINKCILPNPYWKPYMHDDFLPLSKAMNPIHNMIITTLVCKSFSPVSIPYLLWIEIFSFWKWHNLLLM